MLIASWRLYGRNHRIKSSSGTTVKHKIYVQHTAYLLFNSIVAVLRKYFSPIMLRLASLFARFFYLFRQKLFAKFMYEE